MVFDGPVLYEQSMPTRGQIILGVGGGVAVLAAITAALGSVWLWPVAVLALAAGLAGFLTATTHLELTQGHVEARSQVRTRAFDAASCLLDERPDHAFVLTDRTQTRKVICVFTDDDPEKVRSVFAAAGVSVPEPAE